MSFYYVITNLDRVLEHTEEFKFDVNNFEMWYS